MSCYATPDFYVLALQHQHKQQSEAYLVEGPPQLPILSTGKHSEMFMIFYFF